MGIGFPIHLAPPPRMLWHLLPVLSSPRAPLLSSLLRDDRDSQSLALRQQVLVLRRQLRKRCRLSRAERPAMLPACARMEQRQLLDIPIIAKPARKAPLRLLGNLQTVCSASHECRS